MLISLGFIPSIKYDKNKRAYTLLIGGRQKFEFAKILGKELKETFVQKTWQYGYVDENYVYMPITKVGGDVQSSRVVYDLEVEEDHNFSASFVVHNSGE